MANIKSAKKRAKQAIARRQHNTTIRSKYRTLLKKAATMATNGDSETAQNLFRQAQSAGQKATKSNIFQANKIARDIRKLNAKIKAQAVASET